MERMSKQLILSGKLKPEVRLGIEISNFAQSLDDERREEFRRMQTAKGIHLSGWDVIKVTEEINQEGSRRHRTYSSSLFTTFPLLCFGMFRNASLQAPQQVINVYQGPGKLTGRKWVVSYLVFRHSSVLAMS